MAEIVIEAINEEFAEKYVQNIMQKMAYEICDACKVDPLECGSRYGNGRKCRMLADKVNKMYYNDVVVTTSDAS